jgi:hypothetical protein
MAAPLLKSVRHRGVLTDRLERRNNAPEPIRHRPTGVKPVVAAGFYVGGVF